MNAIGQFTRMLREAVSGRMVTRRPDGQGHVEWITYQNTDSPLENQSIEVLWRTQPHLRTVINFLARNIAQIGLHTFTSNGDANERVFNNDVTKLISKPNPRQTRYDLLFNLVGDISLYDRAYLWLMPTPEDEARHRLYVLPPAWVQNTESGFGKEPKYRVTLPNREAAITFGPEEVIEFPGWTPAHPGMSTSPVETLRLTLEEQQHARIHRKQIWKRNGRVGSYITRPKEAPVWDTTGRKRFSEMLEAFVGDRGSRAGGMPILEDGMDMKRIGFSAKDEEWAESAKLSLQTVAQVYHVNPTMIGLLDNANYSNVREFRRSLYGDTLGPIITMIEDRLNAFLLPMIDAPEEIFLEFNVEAKLRGNFEDQAKVISAAVGGPWMTRNEARRLQNLAPLDTGDALIVPLNLGTPEVEEEVVDTDATPKRLAEVWQKTLFRQQSVYPAKGFDTERWDRELAEDLAAAGAKNADQMAQTLNAFVEAKLHAAEQPNQVFKELESVTPLEVVEVIE